MESPKQDKITNEKIILFDQSKKGGRIIKQVEIHTPSGELRTYVLRKTSKGKYLLN